ncbi:MAG: hypothetical protein WCS84_10645 [Nocardioides sp.]
MEPGGSDGCAVCGQAPSENAKFCRRCGARLRSRPAGGDPAEPGTPEEQQEQ